MSNWRAEIPSTIITQEQVGARLQCSICLEDYQLREEVLKLNCEHVFHEACITPWLNRNNFCPTCRSRAVRNNVYVIPSSQDLQVDFLVEYDEDVENVGGGSDVTLESLESESEESYIDGDEDELEENMWSDQSDEDCVIEDSDSEDLSDSLIDNSLIEMVDEIVQSDNDLSDLIEMEEESVQSDNGSMEDNNEELSEEVMSDDSLFYEAETGSILFSEDDDVDNEQ